MNQGIKELWLKALRSGEYQQGRDSLHPTPDTWCCLAVLCEIHRKATGGQWERPGAYYRYDGDSNGLPRSVRNWAGLGTLRYPLIPYNGMEVDLSVLNDGDEALSILPKSFSEIADLIEQHL